jgi:hypothetical protein
MQMSQRSNGKYRANVEQREDGVTIHIAGLGANQVDTAQLASCFNALLACADQNACFQKGFGVACLETIVGHHRESSCISNAFGLGGKRQAQSA